MYVGIYGVAVGCTAGTAAKVRRSEEAEDKHAEGWCTTCHLRIGPRVTATKVVGEVRAIRPKLQFFRR